MSDYLPFEVQREIMLKSGVDDLVRFRNVCRRWRYEIQARDFIRSYGSRTTNPFFLNLAYKQGNDGYLYAVHNDRMCTRIHSQLNLNALKPIATSEGIWCFAFADDMALVLWNPSIQKCVSIILPNFVSQPNSPKMIFGFGVHPRTLDTTLLKINYPLYSQGPWYVHVFTLRSNRWTSIPIDRLPRDSIRIKRKGQAVVGGKNFWVGSEYLNPEGIFSDKVYLIVSFDLLARRFHVQNIPETITSMIPPPFYVTNLGTSLVISGSYIHEDARIICAWIIGIDAAGFINSTTLLFTRVMPYYDLPKLLGFAIDGEPIIEVDVNRVMFLNVVQVYNQNLQSFQNLGAMQGNRGSFIVGPYKESLILVDRPQNKVIYGN